MKKQKILMVFFLLSFLMGIWSPSALAWQWTKKTCAATHNIGALAVSFPSGSIELQRLQEATHLWRLNLSDFKFGVSLADPAVTVINFGDGMSTVAFTADQSVLQGHPGLDMPNYSTQNGCNDEHDILFDANWGFSFGDTLQETENYGGPRLFKTVAMHELGHFMGLDHTHNAMSLMGYDSFFVNVNGGYSHAFVGADAMNGASDMYGMGDSESNTNIFNVSQFQYDGIVQEYGSAVRLKAYESGTNQLLPTYFEFEYDIGEKRWRVTPGNDFDVEFNFDYYGVDVSPTIGVRIVLSSDTTIDLNDPVLLTGSVSFSGNFSSGVIRFPIHLPPNTPQGLYQVGIILDQDNTIENKDSSLASYVPIGVFDYCELFLGQLTSLQGTLKTYQSAIQEAELQLSGLHLNNGFFDQNYWAAKKAEAQAGFDKTLADYKALLEGNTQVCANYHLPDTGSKNPGPDACDGSACNHE